MDSFPHPQLCRHTVCRELIWKTCTAIDNQAGGTLQSEKTCGSGPRGLWWSLVIHVASIRSSVSEAKNVSVMVPAEYLDYTDVSSPNFTVEIILSRWPSKLFVGAPILFLHRIDGSLWLYVNNQGLNNLNWYPLLLIGELLDRLGRTKCFTQLDPTDSYYRMRIREEILPS